jgi:hypothetical protein
MQLSITVHPPESLRVNQEVVVVVAASLLRDKLDKSVFFQKCATRITIKRQGLDIELRPTAELRVFLPSISALVKALMMQIVNENTFLRACNIEFLAENNGELM